MTHPSRGVLAAFIFSLVAVQGLTINLMPVLFGTIARDFGCDLRQQGQLQSIFLAGTVIALFVSGYVTEAIGAKRSGMIVVLLVGIGSVLLGLANGYRPMLVGALVLGIGNSWVLAAYSAVITACFADARQRMFMWATAAYAGSATLSTLVFGYLIDVVPRWNLVFFGFAVLVCGWFAAFFFFFGGKLQGISRPTVVRREVEVARPSGPTTWLDRAGSFLADGLLNRGAFWLLGLLVILDVLGASSIVAWSGRFLQLEHGISDYQVGQTVSASSAGFFLGRIFMATFISGRFSDRMVLGTCYSAGIVFFALALLAPSYPLAMALIFLNGAMIAAQLPTTYSLAAAKFGDRAATAIPLIDAIGTLGGLSGPTLMGILANVHGLGAVLWFIPAVGSVFVAIVFTWEFVDRRRRDADSREH
jgi:MFS family permease